ncbi:MAG: alanine racemase, partial [Myxococcales bacterium]
ADADTTREQIARFREAVAALRRAGHPVSVRHLANSSAVMDLDEVKDGFEVNLVRPGIMLYGEYPAERFQARCALSPVLTWKSAIVQLKRVPAGTRISYGGTWTAPRESLIATLPVGYADGYSRQLSNKGQVLVRGVRAPVVGRVCMDMCMVDVTDVPGAAVHDEVVLVGRQGEAVIGPAELATHCGTIHYEILCAVGARVPRIVVRRGRSSALRPRGPVAEQPVSEPANPAPSPPGGGRLLVEAVGARVMGGIEQLGGIVLMAAQVLVRMWQPPYRLGLLFAQMDFVGVGSIFLVGLTGLFTGMVFAKQSISAFSLFDAESLVGPTVILSITRELGPVFTALMVTKRAGSAMCTELGTMRVTEQIDALQTLAVDPLKYLVVPRVLAGLFMTPVLCMLFDTMGAAGAWFIAVYVEGLSEGTFLARTQSMVDVSDVMEGLIKSAAFGLIITVVACYKGFHASGGSRGVGRATTEAMVTTAVAIFVSDYFLGLLLIGRL